MSQSENNFFYNSMLAKSLVQLLPTHEKPPLRAWFIKLLELSSTPKEIEMRDEYMWFMLMMLQCQKIRNPFNRPPPAEIEPLKDLVDQKVYEEILVANGDNMAWLDKSGIHQSTTEIGSERFGKKGIKLVNDRVHLYLSYSPKNETVQNKIINLPVRYLLVLVDDESEMDLLMAGIKEFSEVNFFSAVEDFQNPSLENDEVEEPVAKKIKLLENRVIKPSKASSSKAEDNTILEVYDLDSDYFESQKYSCIPNNKK